jgi:hypothetical protein
MGGAGTMGEIEVTAVAAVAAETELVFKEKCVC